MMERREEGARRQRIESVVAAIAQPGRASIRAALNPSPNPSAGDPICVGLKANEKCEYLYYVIADKEGGHVFAATFAQHEANIVKAKQVGVM